MGKKINIADFSNGTKKSGAVTFYCYQKQYSFPLPKLDENGKEVYQTDKDGNNKSPLYDTFQFQYLPVIDKDTHKVKVNDPRCFFTVESDNANAERLLKYLTQKIADKHTKIVDEETYLKKENPEAFRIAEAKREAEDKYSTQIKDLQDRLAKAEGAKK